MSSRIHYSLNWNGANASSSPLKIHLAQRNLAHADAFLMDVSDPTSPNYGNHWTPAQIIDAFSPTEEAVKDILEWLLDAGFSGSRVKYAKPQGVSFPTKWYHFADGSEIDLSCSSIFRPSPLI